MGLANLRQQLEALQKQASEIRAKGFIEYPAPFLLDSTTAKGKTYYRRRGKTLAGDPCGSVQISKQEHDELSRQLENGRSLHRLETQIARLKSKIARLDD